LTTIRSIGGPTAIIEVGGFRILTDPTFDPPGEYRLGQRVLTKLEGPAIGPAEIGSMDIVLLSHHQHPDNLDTAGRALLGTVPLVLTTPAAAEALGTPARGLAPWERAEIMGLKVTAVPARHGPPGSEPLTGPVTGFVLEHGDERIYVSGDNAGLDVVTEIAERVGPIDIAVLFAGGARTPLLGDAYLTLNSEMAAEAARILDARAVVPVHFNGWAHFTEGAGDLRRAFTAAHLSDRLVLLQPGASTAIGAG
jgi:L-ascorbate metabolism protein UlaG (beta-lactamase superfamily)